MRIEIDAQDVETIKEKVFSLISEGLLDLPPEERLEKIKVATILETLTPEQMQQMGLKFNLKRDNFNEIIDKIKEY